MDTWPAVHRSTGRLAPRQEADNAVRMTEAGAAGWRRPVGGAAVLAVALTSIVTFGIATNASGRASPAAHRAVASPPATVRYRAPITGRVVVVRPFERPPTPYAAGHRGADLAAATAGLVLAAGAGRVSFAGPVAGRGVVVLVHPDGVSTEYEPLTPLVHAGQQVVLGQPIGRLRGKHGSCAVDACLHWGARRAGEYFDPMLLLRPLGPVRLLPW